MKTRSMVINNQEDVSDILATHFEKNRGGEYFAHLNGSDIVVWRVNTGRWDWTVEGRAHKRGSSKSLKDARVDAWMAGLNSVELAALKRGELTIP